MTGSALGNRQEDHRHRVEHDVCGDARAEPVRAHRQQREHHTEDEEPRKLDGLKVRRAEDGGRHQHTPRRSPAPTRSAQEEASVEQLLDDRSDDRHQQRSTTNATPSARAASSRAGRPTSSGPVNNWISRYSTGTIASCTAAPTRPPVTSAGAASRPNSCLSEPEPFLAASNGAPSRPAHNPTWPTARLSNPISSVPRIPSQATARTVDATCATTKPSTTSPKPQRRPCRSVVTPIRPPPTQALPLRAGCGTRRRARMIAAGRQQAPHRLRPTR